MIRRSTNWHEPRSPYRLAGGREAITGLQERVRRGRYVHPMNLLGYSSDPALLQICAERYARKRCRGCGAAEWRDAAQRQDQDAYVASGFHRHRRPI